MTVHTIITFRPSQAVLDDYESTLKHTAACLRNGKGCTGFYYSPSEEDKEVAFAVIAWDSLELHNAGMSHPNCPWTSPTWAAGEIHTISTLGFRAPPEPAISSGATEILITTLKQGKTIDDEARVLANFGPKVTAQEGCMEPLAWGETLEEKGKTFLFLGWESSKRHFEVVVNEPFKSIIEEFFTVVDHKMFHANFKKLI